MGRNEAARRFSGWPIAVLACLLGCGHDTSPPPRIEAEPTELPCHTACPQSHACYDGVCLPTCDPACPQGTECTVDGRCVGDLATGPGDGFAQNPCGGTAVLPGLPGESCGPCGTGRYVCQSEDVVECVDPVGTNPCGGCGELPGIPASPCGDESRWACAPDGQLECVPWLSMNPCLGTEVIDGPPGRRCGECGSGYFQCTSPNTTECVPGEPPIGTCGCDPRSSPPISCSTDAGICARGVRVCLPTGEYGSCVSAAAAWACESDDDCGPDAWCVTEMVAPEESAQDACRVAGAADCTRRICRSVEGTRGCLDDVDCAPSQGCAAGFCRDLAVRPVSERCNGLDDDCDGRIDNDDQRLSICGQCPYNMTLVVNPDRFYGRERFCIDHFEASRPDATDATTGLLEGYAASRRGVLPWTGVTPDEAIRACAAKAYNAEIEGGVVERRLCVADEWTLGCNQKGDRYPYGDEYLAGACNDASVELDGPLPGGSASACSYAEPGSLSPVYDTSGNVEEWVRGDDGVVLAGGSILDAPTDVTCTSVRPAPAAVDPGDTLIGFRCCVAPVREPELGVEP